MPQAGSACLAGIAEGSGKTAEVYVTHYLEAYDRVVTSKQIVEFTVDETW